MENVPTFLDLDNMLLKNEVIKADAAGGILENNEVAIIVPLGRIFCK